MVNATKTEIVIFGEKIENTVLTFNGEVLDIVDDFIYLEAVFMSNVSFCKEIN